MVLKEHLYKVLISEGKYKEAEDLCREVMAFFARLTGTSSPSYADGLFYLAETMRLEHNYAQAEPLYQQALSINDKYFQQQFGADDLHVAKSLTGLGQLYMDWGKYIQAEEPLKRALSIRQKVLPPADPLIAQAMENYSQLLNKTGHDQEAKALQKKANLIMESP